MTWLEGRFEPEEEVPYHIRDNLLIGVTFFVSPLILHFHRLVMFLINQGLGLYLWP